MKPEELMIGDWLLWDNTLPCIVTTIGCDYIETTKCGITLAESHLLQGVPLTPEILEQNGFVKQAYDGWLIIENNGRGTIEYRTDYFDGMLRINYTKKPFSKISIKLKYVHELQHALRLCGIDKTIEV